MKKLLLFTLACFFCSQICLAEERITTLSLKDGSEVSGEYLGLSNGVYKIRTDSGIVEVKSSEVMGMSQEVNFSWDDLGIKKEEFDEAIEELNDRIENYSGNQSDSYEESSDSDYQKDSYKEQSNDSDYQKDSYEEQSNDSDYQSDSYEEEYNYQNED